ncbi:Poly-beta-1,6-N-acetyl-D-glucosamine synthase [Listeria ivanovii subsp. londoniensis]|uniref:Glycosyltransferase n=2 Tax=Listeria ivanovii TaxID=1638 RepID=A0ABS1G8J4_LISIV|nr:glycosyltransferase family 2 protein [Listeria ivanovii]EFR98162.1 glycosyl transferase [Listeria ivanovii FSL F6-596]AIS58836.1 glycosyl transferase [Listeria ivanovii subsp. londoniensis]MBK1963212.1 glycosyltransferase [Listeria ivanovii subsp. londoniensis]SDX11208.1 poly-beta-1,6 N-acetyl-D-glucosamine synthase [Listeria ivanovii]VEH44804.1 Poly-beta-1,6-N-acetyl-D-glucosamine synthase [Listeria ivanovii subsp. londoniensis]
MNLSVIDTGIPAINIFITFLFVILLTYPILGGFAWFVGAFCYTFLFKYKQENWTDIPTTVEPFITIMVPAHNEEVVIEGTIEYLMNKINYTNYEILVTDDGSTDSTPAILDQLMEKYDNLRVVRIEKNKGKAHAFNIGTAFAKGELILSNDADTVPEPDALWKYVNYFIREDAHNIAAVTSNMDVQNRSTLVGKSQTVEFSSIVGIIKRTQTSVFGVIYAYSGANTMYRKDALMDVGMFRQDRATEDISIAWDHQSDGWLSLFATDIIFFMEVPETLNMLYKQRKRWAKGGTEVWLTNFKKVLRHPFQNIGRTSLFVDQTLSISWTFFFWISSAIFFARFIYLLFIWDTQQILFMLTVAFVFVCFEMVAGILQLLAALLIDDKGNKLKYFLFTPLYLLFYWIMNAVTILMTFIPAVKTILGFGTGVWTSPERRQK